MDVEACKELPAERYQEVAPRIEHELRARLQVQTTVTLLEPRALPRTAYKTPLVHVRDGGA